MCYVIRALLVIVILVVLFFFFVVERRTNRTRPDDDGLSSTKVESEGRESFADRRYVENVPPDRVYQIELISVSFHSSL